MESARDARPLRILDHGGFLSRQLHDGKQISGIFRCLYFNTTCFKMDWLHVLDLGCSQDVLGILANYAVFGAQSGREVAALQLEMRNFYQENTIAKLTVTMIRKQSSSPKLNNRAAESRAPIPFALRMAERYLNRRSNMDAAILRIHGASQAATTG